MLRLKEGKKRTTNGSVEEGTVVDLDVTWMFGTGQRVGLSPREDGSTVSCQQ